MSTAVMTEQSSPCPGARTIGVVYLLYFVVAMVGELFIRGMVVSGDAAATANNILARQSLLRLGLATGLVGTALFMWL